MKSRRRAGAASSASATGRVFQKLDESLHETSRHGFLTLFATEYREIIVSATYGVIQHAKFEQHSRMVRQVRICQVGSGQNSIVSKVVRHGQTRLLGVCVA